MYVYDINLICVLFSLIILSSHSGTGFCKGTRALGAEFNPRLVPANIGAGNPSTVSLLRAPVWQLRRYSPSLFNWSDNEYSFPVPTVSPGFNIRITWGSARHEKIDAQPVHCFEVIFSYKIVVGHVAVITHRISTVRGVRPGSIFRRHNVAVDAGFRIIGQIELGFGNV